MVLHFIKNCGTSLSRSPNKGTVRSLIGYYFTAKMDNANMFLISGLLNDAIAKLDLIDVLTNPDISQIDVRPHLSIDSTRKSSSVGRNH